jgi:hypothetical protein
MKGYGTDFWGVSSSSLNVLAAIGRFVPPQEAQSNSEKQSYRDITPPKWVDPKMRKSTEFPPWLDRPETRNEIKGKQVLMYCTGKFAAVTFDVGINNTMHLTLAITWHCSQVVFAVRERLLY